MRIGIDIDGVMYNWDKTARYMLREILPDSPYTRDGPLGTPGQYWDYIEHNVSPEHWKWLWTDGVQLGLFRHGHMVPGTIKAIRQLAEIGDVVAITHRPKQAVEDTLAWLGFHRLPLAGIHILTNGEPKTSVARCDFYLDDKPENCRDFAVAGACSALLDGPVNRWWKETDGVERVLDWDEFVELVDEFAS